MSIYEPPWKAKLPGPAKYYISETITTLGKPSVKILPRPRDAPDSRQNYPAADHYDVLRWPDQPYGDPHAGDSERQTDEAAHAMPGGIYEVEWKKALPGPGSYEPTRDKITRPRLDILTTMTPHDTWRTAPIPEWKQEINNVPMRILPSTLLTEPAITLRHKPNDAPDSRLHYPAPHDRAPKRWPKNVPPSFHNVAAVPYPDESAHSMEGGIYDPPWKVELPGPSAHTPKVTLTKPSSTISATMIPHDTWRTEPLPLWKQEVNNVPHVILPSTLNTQPATKIQSKNPPPMDSRTKYPAPDKYNVPRWPKEPYELQKNGSADTMAVALRYQREAAQKKLVEVLRPVFPDRYEERIHINPAGANYTPNENSIRPNMPVVTLAPHDTWRTEPIPLWKQEVNNVPYRTLPSTLNTQPATKIQSKPYYPEEDHIKNPGPDMYNVLRFPQNHHQSTAGNMGTKNTSTTGRIIQNQPRPRPISTFPASSLRPTDLPPGYKRGYSEQLQQWYWYDPSGQKPLRIAKEDSSRYLAKKAALEQKNHAIMSTMLYQEDGGKLVRGVVRASKKWDHRRGIPSKGALDSLKSSPFLNLATHDKTKSGMNIPRQSTMSIPLSSLSSQKKDLMQFLKRARGPNIVAKGPPVIHGMYVKSEQPARASAEEISRALENKIAGMTNRLERKGIHSTWEDGVVSGSGSGSGSGNGSSNGNSNSNSNDTIIHDGRENGRENIVARNFDIRTSATIHRIEDEKVHQEEDHENHDKEKQIGNKKMALELSKPLTVPGDTVFYRLPSGIIKRSTVIALPTANDGWILRLRAGGPLVRQVRSVNVTLGEQPPLCSCGKFGAHKGKCFRKATF